MKSGLASFRSMKNNAAGHLFEDGITRGCAYYENIGYARIIKIPEPFRTLRKKAGGRAEVQFTANAEPDFMGCIHTGRLMVFEAKYTSTDRIKQDVVTRQQADSLQRYTELGAIAGVCVGMGDKAYFVPWLIYSRMGDLFGHKYMQELDLAPYKVRHTGTVFFCDGMATLQQFIMGKQY